MTALNELQIAEGLVDRDPVEALRLIDRVAAKAQKDNQPGLALESHLLRGKVLTRQGCFAEALTERMEALRLAQSLPDRNKEAGCLQQIGEDQERLGQPVAAMGSFEKSLKLYRLLKQEAQAAQVQVQMGMLWGHIGETAKGLSLVEASLPVLAAQPNTPVYALALGGRVGLKLERFAAGAEKPTRSSLDGFLAQIEQAQGIAQAHEDKHLERQLLLVRAKAFTLGGKAADAQFVLEQLLKQARAAKDHHTQLLALQALAQSHQGLGHHDRALEVLLEALKLAQQHKYPQLAQVHLLLSQVYEQSQDLVEALRHVKVFYELSQKESGPALQERLEVEELKRQLGLLQQELQQGRKQLEELSLHNRQLDLKAKTLEHHASREALTGLANRYHFERSLAQSLETRQGVVVAIADIDRFKEVNKTFGRAIGDKVLSCVAQLIQQQARGEDLVAHLSGEEFGLLLYGTDTQHAQIACERMRQAIEGFDWAQVEPGLRVTISLGYALAFDGNNVLEEAHGYLLEAKAMGYNRVYPARKQ